MNHRFLEGNILHHRFLPKKHRFVYDFFFLDIDVYDLPSLKSSFFSSSSFAPMGFFARDHFGQDDSLLLNAQTLFQTLGWEEPPHLRFITLPRIFHFVFNPISILLLLDASEKPTHMVVEVHNYNGGRVLYPMVLAHEKSDFYKGEHPKTLYVSPFLGFDGMYTFHISYTPTHFSLRIELSQMDTPMLLTSFTGESLPFSQQNIKHLLCQHTFLTLFVVTHTLWQSLRLWLKGIAWMGPRNIDQTRKDLTRKELT